MTQPEAMPTWALDTADADDKKDATQWLGDFLSEYDDETRRKYRINLSQFFLWMDRYRHYVPILNAEPKHIRAYEVYLKSKHWEQHPGECVMECKAGVLPYASSSIATKRAAISSFFSWCVSEPGCPVTHNPVSPKRGRQASGDDANESLKDILLPDEIMEMRAVALQAATGRRVKIPTLRTAVVSGMFVGAGLRCAELENARVENLGWRGRSSTLRFLRKNGRWQTIDLGYNLGPLVREYVGDRKFGPLIITDGRMKRNPETGELERGGVSSDTLRDILTDLSTASGIRPGTMHPHLPARLAHHARRRWLRIESTWPWATAFTTCWQRLTALPAIT